MKLLERDELLGKLQTRLQQAAAGPGALVFVEGEAGIGKTSLLRSCASTPPPRWRGFSKGGGGVSERSERTIRQQSRRRLRSVGSSTEVAA